MANDLEYGVRLVLDSSQALRDVEILMQKLKTLQNSAKLRVTTDVSELSTEIQKCIQVSSELAKTMGNVDATFKSSGDQVAKFGDTVKNASKSASSNIKKDVSDASKEAARHAKESSMRIIQSIGSIVKFSNSAGQDIANSLVGAFKKASSAMTEFMSDAFSQYQDLQLAEIAFDKLYDGNASELITKVKRKSEQMPLLGASELGNAMKSVSPVANRNPDLALRAVEGILKGTLYSGNDIKQFPNMFQNIQQLASGSSTAQDVKELLRAIPTLPSLLKELVLDAELTDNGVLSSKKIQNYVKKNGSQSLLEIFAKIGEDTSASDAYERIRGTWKGITEEIAETITNRWNDALDKSGFYDTITNMLKTLNDSGRLENFMDKLASYVGKFAQWINANQNTIFEFLDVLVDNLWKFVDTIGQVAKNLLTNIGILDKGGNLDKDRLNQLLGYLSSFLTEFVKTITTGVEQLVGLADMLGENGIGNLGGFLGFMGSPLGGGISGILGNGFLQNAAGTFLGNKLAGVGGGGLKGIVSGAGIMGRDMLNAVKPSTLGARMASTSGLATIGSAGSLIAGVAVGLATKGLISFGSQLIESTNLFGNQSKDFANSLNVAGNGVSVLVGTLVATGNPLIATAAGVTTALGGFISEVDKAAEAIKENARKNADGYLYSSVSEKKKSIISDVFEELGRAGVDIDANSDIGKFVSTSLEDYLDKTPATKWDSTEAVKTAIRAKEYKEKAWQLAALDETDAYKSARNSQLIDLNGDSDYVRNMYGKMSRMIEDFHLLGDDYDYNSSDRDVVRSFLGGNSLTVGQYDLYMKTYEKAISEARSTSDSIVKSIENDLTAFFTDEDGTVQTFKDVFDQSKDTFIKGLTEYFANPANALTDALRDVLGSEAYNAILEYRGGNKDTNEGKGFWENVGDWFAHGAIFSPIYDWIHKAQGGEVDGTMLDSHGIDTVPAMLAPGEFVMKQSAVSKFGREAMEALNHGDPTALTRHVTSNLNNSWDYSRSSRTTNNNQQAIRNYYINNQLAKRTRMPYYSLRNMMSGA